MEITKLHDKIKSEITSTQELAAVNLRKVERDIKEQIRAFQK